MINGQRDPHVLAAMVRGRLVVKHDALVIAPPGCFAEHHAFLCRTLLETIDHLDGQISALTERITRTLAAMPATYGEEPGADPPPESAGLLAPAARLDEIPGIGPVTAKVILVAVARSILGSSGT